MIFITEQTYLPIIQSMGAQYNVDPALILAHIKQESGFNPTAYRAEPEINDASYGIMQILLSTAKTIDSSSTVQKLYDSTFNISVGTRYIAGNMARYPNDIESTIAAYNAGSAYINANVDYTNSKGDTSVQDYVDNVMKNYAMYTSWINNGASSIDLTADPDTPFYFLFLILGGAAFYMYTRRRNG